VLSLDFGIYAEAIDRKIRERNAERRAAWCHRVCAGIDAARRAPVTAAELRERNGETGSENRRER
jgi:hypothetical protein